MSIAGRSVLVTGAGKRICRANAIDLYCASKGALDGLTRVMANELGHRGIRVNGGHPVVTLTPMAEKGWSDPAKSRPMLDRIPLRRFVEPG